LENRAHERTDRLGFLTALRALLEADAVLLLGTDDPGYSPSKIYPVLLTGRPVFALGPADSVLARKIKELGGAVFLPTADAASLDKLRDLLHLVVRGEPLPGPALDASRLQSVYSADAIAAQQLEVFNRLLRHRP
jgi:hypothetical protein